MNKWNLKHQIYWSIDTGRTWFAIIVNLYCSFVEVYYLNAPLGLHYSSAEL